MKRPKGGSFWDFMGFSLSFLSFFKLWPIGTNKKLAKNLSEGFETVWKIWNATFALFELKRQCHEIFEVFFLLSKQLLPVLLEVIYDDFELCRVFAEIFK